MMSYTVGHEATTHAAEALCASLVPPPARPTAPHRRSLAGLSLRRLAISPLVSLPLLRRARNAIDYRIVARQNRRVKRASDRGDVPAALRHSRKATKATLRVLDRAFGRPGRGGGGKKIGRAHV